MFGGATAISTKFGIDSWIKRDGFFIAYHIV